MEYLKIAFKLGKADYFLRAAKNNMVYFMKNKDSKNIYERFFLASYVYHLFNKAWEAYEDLGYLVDELDYRDCDFFNDLDDFEESLYAFKNKICMGFLENQRVVF